MIEERLKLIYTEGAFKAYNKLGNVRWMGEQVVDYANEIRRLVTLAGFFFRRGSGKNSEVGLCNGIS